MPHSLAEMVEAPGTAPGSTTIIPRTVYHHSQQADGRRYNHPAFGMEGLVSIAPTPR